MYKLLSKIHIRNKFMDMFDLPTEKELLGKVKAHLETQKPIKSLDVNDVFPFWNSTACSEVTMKTFKPGKDIVMKNDKVGGVKPIKSSPLTRLRGQSSLTSTAQKKPEVKCEATSKTTPKFKPLNIDTTTVYKVKSAPNKVGSINPINPGEHVELTDFQKILKQMKANNMPNMVGCVKPVKAPSLKHSVSEFGVVTSEKPMKNPNPKAYAQYVTRDNNNKKTEKMVELGKPEYKKTAPKASKTDLVGCVKPIKK